MSLLLITSSLIILFLLYLYINRRKEIIKIPVPIPTINRYDVPVFKFYSVVKISELDLKLLTIPKDKHINKILLDKLSHQIAEELQKSGTIEVENKVSEGYEEVCYKTKVAFLK